MWGVSERMKLGQTFCADREVRLKFRGEGAHPWILGRRGGVARGIRNQLAADGRFPSRAIPNGSQFCLNAMKSHGGFLAYRSASVSNPAKIWQPKYVA